MATTLSALLSLPSVWPSLKNVSHSLNLAPTLAVADPSLARLADLSAAYPDLPPYLTREMLVRAHAFMTGIGLYRNHPVRRAAETAPIVWQDGTTCLRDYAPDAPARAVPVLIVPSLVNRFTILDIEPTHSFVRFLAALGYRPFVVDWDEPGPAEKDFGLDAYVTQRLVPALQLIAAQRPAHIIGYCMGGNLAVALAALQPALTRSLILLATPWDFQAGYESQGQDGTLLEAKLDLWLADNDYLPVEVVQSVFTAFQPLHAFRKFSAFSGYDQASKQAARFVLTEDWLNDGIPLTAPVARECFGDWFSRNVTAKNLWRIGGQIIDPAQISTPSYVVVAGRDHIVPPQSARPLAQALPGATVDEPLMGHIGIMSSPAAPAKVWKNLALWLAER